MQCGYKCAVFKLLNRLTISPRGVPDLIQFFSELATIYRTFWVSAAPVRYLRKSSASEFGPLNSSAAKWESVK
jgi:hypothetical protein